jgi:protein-S-isoprenylcysteine O-methyltransferase Ste14
MVIKKKYKFYVLAVASALIGELLYEVLDRSNIGIWFGGLGLLAFMVLGLIGVFGCKSD